MPQYVSLIAIVVLAIASVSFVWFGLTNASADGQRISRRLAGASQRVVGAVGSVRLPNLKKAALVDEEGALAELNRYLTPNSQERFSRIRRRLMLAGYRQPAAVRIYFAVKWSIAIGGFAVGALMFSLTMNPAEPLTPMVLVGLVVALSFFATDMWVERRVVYRRMAIERAFPDTLDLLLVCIEAGNGMDQALARVANEIAFPAPELSQELRLAVAQLRAGRDREQVLHDFSTRTNVPDIASFGTVLRQADKFGVSIGETLRVYAGEMRNKRFSRAEESANMMPVKLALGAILFTVPPTIMILIGPSIIMIVREMAKAAAGG